MAGGGRCNATNPSIRSNRKAEYGPRHEHVYSGQYPYTSSDLVGTSSQPPFPGSISIGPARARA